MMRCVMAVLWLLALCAQAGAAAALETRRVARDGALFDVVIIDLRRVELHVYSKDARGEHLGSFARLAQHLAQQGKPLLAATNAGIFEPGFVATGLHVERGRVLRPLNLAAGQGNFFMQPNGVFFLGPRGAAIVPSPRYPALASGVVEATQSGPLLLHEGRVPGALSPRSQNRKLRSGIGVISPTRVALAISRGAVTFHALAQVFAVDLGCRDALYLDGTISDLYAPALGRGASVEKRFAGLLGVTPR